MLYSSQRFSEFLAKYGSVIVQYYHLKEGDRSVNLSEYQNYHEAKSHTSADFPYNTYLCSIPLDFTQVPLHWHEELEMVVIQKGEGTISVDFDRQAVRAGDMVFIRPGQLHSIEQSGTKKMEYENIILKKELLISGEGDLCVRSGLSDR